MAGRGVEAVIRVARFDPSLVSAQTHDKETRKSSMRQKDSGAIPQGLLIGADPHAL